MERYEVECCFLSRETTQWQDQGPVFGHERPFLKLRPAYSVKLVFSCCKSLGFEDNHVIQNAPEKPRVFRETGPSSYSILPGNQLWIVNEPRHSAWWPQRDEVILCKSENISQNIPVSFPVHGFHSWLMGIFSCCYCCCCCYNCNVQFTWRYDGVHVDLHIST